MKISKVNHTSTGVGVKSNGSEGMLYKNPSKVGADAKYEGDELTNRVNELNNNAKNLYCLFNESKEKDLNKQTKDIKKVVNIFTKELVIRSRKDQIFLVRNYLNEQITYKERGESYTKTGRQLSLVKKIEKKTADSRPTTGMAALLANAGFAVESDSYISEYENLVRIYVDRCLRKAYCGVVKFNGKKINLKPVVTELVVALIDQNAYDSKIKKLTDDEINAFLEKLDEDYNKEKRLKKVIKSIKNQDTKVQVKSKNGETLLAPASAYNDKKKPLFDFMIEYSEKNDAGRKELRGEKRAFISRYLESGNSDGTVFSEKIENALCKYIQLDYKFKKDEKKQLKAEIDEMVRNEMVAKYQDMLSSIDADDTQSKYWLKFFADETEEWVKTEIKKRNGLSYNDNKRRLLLSDLFEHLYKYFLSYMATKYIDLGKGVYHFTDFSGKRIGELLPDFKDGISSFDYERIAAEERVRRDMSTYVAFAVNNYANSVCTLDALKKKDDALSINPNECPEMIRDNAKKRVLRFFGGESEWNCLSDVSENEFIQEFRTNISAVRNSTVHFDAKFDEGRAEKKQDIILRMFNEEYSKVSDIFAKKYYSNNLPLFYQVSDIYNLVGNTLYRTDRPVVAAVPSFTKIVPRSKIGEFLKEWIGRDRVYKIKNFNNELLIKLESALFFTLKEIYYYGFLADENLMSYFDKALSTIEPKNLNDRKAREEKKAYDNFTMRYKEIKHSGIESASDLCERMMINYALQNNEFKEVKTSKNADAFEKEIYQHYRIILYKLIKVAFVDYINSNNGYKFLKNPENREEVLNKLTVEDFASNLHVDVYVSAKEAVKDPEVLSWYAIAHFMNKKQINLLCGAIRTELKYLADIDRRALSTKNSAGKNTKKQISKYTNLLRVLEFTMNFADQISNNVFDYYDSEDEYAEKIAVFVDYPKNKFAKNSLVSFCNTEVRGSKNGKIGIFYDAENPIINKNVIRADLYGNDNLFSSGIIKKVTLDDIKEYYSMLSKTDDIFFNNEVRTRKEQQLIRNFQNLKNRIELTDVVTYSEMINDLYGQLLTWIYLRERDLIYMQLGVYYTKLYWGNSVSPADPMNRYEEGDEYTFDRGAILYFIKAMYSHDMKLPKKIGDGVGAFIKYYGASAYMHCLELFEKDERAHDDAVALRNYIAHFKYFSKLDHSIEELYGDIFSEFFAYNVNYHKSVPVVYKNILAQYKLIADIGATESESETYGRAARPYNNVKWVIKPDYTVRTKFGPKTVHGLESDKLTFKVKQEIDRNGRKTKDTADFDAHDSAFIDNVKRIVAYKK